MMDGLLPYYYRMENMVALYGVNPQDDIEVDLRADYTTQVIYVLITSDNSTVPGVLNQNGVQPAIEASGKFYKLIRTTVSDTTKIEITSKRQSNVNVRIWINSPNTAFLAAHSDPSVDVGSAVVSSDYPAETPFQCFNGGTLSGGSCVCSSLFTGLNCAVPICLNGGEVEKFPGNGRPLCECPGGYGGDHCDICQPHETVLVSQYANSSSFLKAVTSSAIGYQNSQSVTQPSFDALLLTINSISYDKSSVFLFTDSAPNANTSRTRMTNIVEAAVERQLQINIIITPPYQMNNLCAKSVDLTDYFTLALQTVGTLVTTEDHSPSTLQFLSGYGMSHHHVESVQEAVFNNCSGVNQVQFFVDNPTSQVYAFVNSATDESFRVQLSNNDLAPDAYQLPSSVQTPFFGMYEITSAVQNTNGYTLYVSPANNTSTGWCSVRIVEKTQLAVYLGFTTDPSRDSPSQTLRYATALHPVLHVSSQLQSDVQPTLMTFNIDGSTRYKAIGVRRMPTCRYESFFEEVLTCSEPNDYFISTITFVVERNIAMVMPSIYLQQMIASFVAASESNDIPKQYSLITFDENVVTNVVSTSNADRFLNAFNNALNNFTNSNPISTKLVDAIQEAYKISIQPPSLIYAFTSHNASKVSTSFLKQQLGIQVNVFFMQTTDFPQQPNGFYVPMIVRQSGGRLLPLTVLATRNDCSSPQTVEFFVESTAARVVLDITGNGVSVAGAVSIFDGKGSLLIVLC
ncbi:unnamed protein product [Nippostrongylus brasiliensis]|uniref:EGF-like domain-containing protein n=1 Tax=Nippostrongylus brasiliensis TaxID=27835 RepID=A0A158R0Y1_NIPBR|nr:unnamed protein product [Nippostrongylus brasiliensis]